MSRWKRGFCGILSAFFFLFAPVQSYASVTAAVLAVGTYSLTTILAACGIACTSVGLAALFGSEWDDVYTYRVLGAAGELGGYAQRVYDGARDTASEAMEKFQQLEETLIACVSSAWGSTISGIGALILDIKEFLKSCVGYGQSGTTWCIPETTPDKVWGQSRWSTFTKIYNPYDYTDEFLSDTENFTYFLTSYDYAYEGTDTMKVKNFYYFNNDLPEIFGLYDPDTFELKFRIPKSGTLTLSSYSKSISLRCSYAYVYEDGSIERTGTESYSSAYCSPECADSLPFPVFTSDVAAYKYVTTGIASDTYNHMTNIFSMDVDSFREDVAEGTVADTLVLPESADLAEDYIAAIQSSYADAIASELEQLLANAGLTVTVTDIPADDTVDKPTDDTDNPAGSTDSTVTVGDQAIVDAIEALPGDVADIIADSMAVDSELAEEQLSLPAVIVSKFPFCIPFDLIHLVQALSAEKEVPRFEIPIQFDYQDFHYDETFIVDMAVFDPAVNIFRVMMDLLFCAGLITVTRKLIRG